MRHSDLRAGRNQAPSKSHLSLPPCPIAATSTQPESAVGKVVRSPGQASGPKQRGEPAAATTPEHPPHQLAEAPGGYKGHTIAARDSGHRHAHARARRAHACTRTRACMHPGTHTRTHGRARQKPCTNASRGGFAYVCARVHVQRHTHVHEPMHRHASAGVRSLSGAREHAPTAVQAMHTHTCMHTSTSAHTCISTRTHSSAKSTPRMPAQARGPGGA